MNNHPLNSTAARLAAVLALIITLAVIPAAAQMGAGNQFGQPSTAPGSGMAGNGTPGAGTCTACTASATPLTATQISQLKYMREEEKLARDLYTALNAKWSLRVFDRISQSEQRHFDAIGRQLTVNSIADPSADKKAGEFSNTTLQKLYNDLLVRGTTSVKDALEVAIIVEETDIADLEEILAAETSATLKRVYNSLLNGSMAHLDAFEACVELYNAK